MENEFKLTKLQEETILEIFQISFYELIEIKQPYFIEYKDNFKYFLKVDYNNKTFSLERERI